MIAHNYLRPLSVTIATVLLCLQSTTKASEALGILPDSGGAIGRVGGRLATLDDPSTVRTNPANMLDLTESELLINTGYWHGDLGFKSGGGDSVSLKDDWSYLGSAYLVMPITDDITFGLGLSTPFGLSYDFPKQSTLRYTAPHEALLLTLDLSLAIAFRISETMTIGIGAEIMYSELKLRQFYPWSALTGSPLTADGELRWDADGWGFGGFAGINWDFAPGQRLALTGRLPITVEYDGTFEAEGIPSALGPLGFSDQSDFESEIKFPGSLGLGYAIDLTERLTVSADFQYFFNSSHKNIPLNIGGNQALLGGADGVVLNWRDSYDIGIGLQYQLSEHWKLRCGYLYSSNPYPEKTYTPSVPSNDRHIASIGIGYETDRHRVDLAYSYVYTPDRRISSNQQEAFVGDYSINWNILTLSYGLKF